jgi:hypothetical protein
MKMCHRVCNSLSNNGFKILIRPAVQKIFLPTFFNDFRLIFVKNHSVNTTHKIKILRRLRFRKLPEATPGTIIFFLVFIESFIFSQVISLKTRKNKKL